MTKYNNGNPLRVVTLCSGYDSQCLAINRLGIPYELVAWSEIDKYAIQAHDALFPQWADRNLGDMTKIDWAQVPDFDLLTYSTPCQSISSAGLQHGFTEGSDTRSSIIWNVRDAIKVRCLASSQRMTTRSSMMMNGFMLTNNNKHKTL